jgi:hypothetical protein
MTHTINSHENIKYERRERVVTSHGKCVLQEDLLSHYFKGNLIHHKSKNINGSKRIQFRQQKEM